MFSRLTTNGVLGDFTTQWWHGGFPVFGGPEINIGASR